MLVVSTTKPLNAGIENDIAVFVFEFANVFFEPIASKNTFVETNGWH